MKLVLTLYKNLGSFLTTQNSTLRLSLGLGQGSDTRRRSLVVNSHVISASVHRGSTRVYLSEPVIFTLRHLQVHSQISFRLFRLKRFKPLCRIRSRSACMCCYYAFCCVCLHSWRTTPAQTALSGTHREFLGMAGGPRRAAACYTPTIHTRPVPATTCPAMLSS